MKKINVLSLFNGMSFGMMALEDIGVTVDKYYSSEIDKYAIQATQALFPDTIQLGDITQWRDWDIDWSGIDLVTGGFPCQAWSMAGKQLGDKDERGMLFWVMLDIMKHVKYHNPKVDFMIENVKMKKEFEEYITTHTENALGKVHKILINSALVSAQNRNRYYWTSFAVEQPKDKGILLKDIIEGGTIDATIMTDTFAERQKGRKCLVDEPKDKASNLSAMEYVKNGRQSDYIQCDKDGNQTVFRPCELREPLSFTEWSKNLKPGTREFEFEDIAEAKYALYCDDWYNKKSLCHHVATATDINANESNKRVYADTGKAPTVTTMGGGHRQPKVFVSFVNDNERVGAITENDRGYRPHKNDASKSGISELGRIMKPDAKTDTVTTTHAPKLAVNNDINNLKYRKLTPRECFRLQTVPEHHIETLLNAGISNSQLYKMCGNGWTMKVISHIFSAMIKKH